MSLSIFLIFTVLMCSRGIIGSETNETKSTEAIVFQPNKNERRHLNVSSPEFHKIAKETYQKVLPCITSTWMMENKHINFRFPDDAEAHYHDLLKRTAPYRQQHYHYYAGYHGPWIENHFISHFSSHPLATFGGLIPLFVQWVDIQVGHTDLYHAIREVLKKALRPDVLYFTVSQCDVGIEDISTEHPNLLVFSAGGFGHIPVPLIKGELPYTPPPVSYQTDIGFYGTVKGRSNRPDMMAIFEQAASQHHWTFRAGPSKSWVQDMTNTKFNLSPRGVGRTSFRFAEIIQMGRVPIFLYNDIRWIPYEKSIYNISSYGLEGILSADRKTNTIPQIITEIQNMSPVKGSCRWSKRFVTCLRMRE